MKFVIAAIMALALGTASEAGETKCEGKVCRKVTFSYAGPRVTRERSITLERPRLLQKMRRWRCCK